MSFFHQIFQISFLEKDAEIKKKKKVFESRSSTLHWRKKQQHKVGLIARLQINFCQFHHWDFGPVLVRVISTQVKSSSGWRKRHLVLTAKCLHTKARNLYKQGMRKWEKMIIPEFSKTLKVMDKVKAKSFLTREDRLYTYWTSLNSNFLQNEANYRAHKVDKWWSAQLGA